MLTLSALTAELKSLKNPVKANILQRFFKTGPGQYGEGDVFLGIQVPVSRSLAKKYATLNLKDVKTLLQNKIHEFRLVGILILVAQYQAGDNQKKAAIFRFYLQNTKHINNWDLVDLSADKIIGDYLLLSGEGLALLNKLVVSRNMWERRIAMIATYAFIRSGRAKETFKIAQQLLADKHDLIHKAVGWMLREVGKRVSRPELKRFLDKNIKKMSRTTLRYAIEHFPETERQFYLKQ